MITESEVAEAGEALAALAEPKRDDAQLGAALDPLRALPPVGAVCDRCGSGLGHLAPHPSKAEVLWAERLVGRKRRRGGWSDLEWADRTGADPSLLPTIGYAPGSRDAERQARRTMRGAGPNRLSFKCRGCPAAPVVTNSTLLRKLLEAYSSGGNVRL